MPHIHTEPGQIDHTVSAYIVRYDAAGVARVLLHRHKKLGVYLQFGGHIELTETSWQAIAHEVEEESGYDFSSLKVLQPQLRMPILSRSSLHPQPLSMTTHRFGPTSDHYHSDTAYVFIADTEPQNPPKTGESAKLVWFTLDQITSLSSDDIYTDTVEIIESIFTLFLPEWEPVATTVYTRELPALG